MKHAVILALVLTSSVACSDDPAPVEATEHTGTVATVAIDFPSLEAFEYLAGWEAISAEGKREREADLLRRIDEMTEDYGLPEAAASAAPGALNPRPRACQLLPGSMQILGERASTGSWTEADRELAKRIARLARYIDPTARFDFDTDVQPVAELRRLAGWFESQTGDPKTLGLMISSLYSGPWYPREAARELEISVDETKSLPGGIQLEIGHRDDGTWCMRGRTGSTVQWVKDLGMPADQPVAFDDQEAVDLGPYGWRLRMVFGDPADFYVSDVGEALFYFTQN